MNTTNVEVAKSVKKATKAPAKKVASTKAPSKTRKSVNAEEKKLKGRQEVIPQIADVSEKLQVPANAKTLGQVMPELRDEENAGWRAAGLVDRKVVRVVERGDSAADDAESEEMWPGKSKYIELWVILEDGHAVGRHRGPRNRVSYHMMSKKSLQNLGLL